MVSKEWHLLFSGELTDAPGRCESVTEELRYEGNDQWTVRASGSDFSGTEDGESFEEHHDTESLIAWVIESDEMFEESPTGGDLSIENEQIDKIQLGERAICLKAIAKEENVSNCVEILKKYEAGKWPLPPEVLDVLGVVKKKRMLSYKSVKPCAVYEVMTDAGKMLMPPPNLDGKTVLFSEKTQVLFSYSPPVTNEIILPKEILLKLAGFEEYLNKMNEELRGN